ncbi:MAG: TetR family transcriptional regulator, partial [Ignavibacteriaceae bacterium]
MNNDKEKILELAREIFLQEGFYKTSLDGIAQQLKISKKTIYKHFRSKDELVRESIINFIQLNHQNTSKLVSTDHNKENITKAGFDDKIILMTGNAFDVMPRLDKKYDFIFLDADKSDYKRLFDYCLILLKKGGIIFVDNLLWSGYAASSRV